MKIRTIYFKTNNMKELITFWKNLLEIELNKESEEWCELKISNIRLGFLLNNFDDKYSGSNCVPVFEFDDKEIHKYIERAKKLGAKMIIDGLNDPNLKSVVFSDPFGNEFEISIFHD